MKKLLKRSATALIIAGATVLFSQSALACDPAQGSGQCTWDGIHHGNNPFPVNNGGYGNYGYSNNIGSNYPRQPTTKTECKMLNNGNKYCVTYSLFTGNVTNEETLNPKTGKPVFTKFYHATGNINIETPFDQQGEIHGTKKYYEPTGELYAVETYEHGKKISAVYDNNMGKITKETYEYTPQFKIEHQRVYVNGVQHGLEIKQFFHDKKNRWVTLYKVNWVNGKKHGTEKIYSLVNDKGKTKLDKEIKWNNGTQAR